MTPVVCRKVDMLSEVEGRKKRQELRSKIVGTTTEAHCFIFKIYSRIIEVNTEVAGYDKFMRSGGSKR